MTRSPSTSRVEARPWSERAEPLQQPRNVQTRPLTEKQRRFLAEYLIDRNAVQAYLRAFGPAVSYRSAATLSGRLLKKVEVRNAIREERQAHARRCRVSADAVLKELALIAFSDLRDFFGDGWTLRPFDEIPSAARRSVSRITIRRTADGAELISVAFWPKGFALGKLLRHLNGSPRRNTRVR